MNAADLIEQGAPHLKMRIRAPSVLAGQSGSDQQLFVDG
jgi:hypothetical protein